MSLKKKAEILLFPAAFAAGIITGVVIGRTKKKAAYISAVEGALNEELPTAEKDESPSAAADDFAADEDERPVSAADDFAADEDESPVPAADDFAAEEEITQVKGKT